MSMKKGSMPSTKFGYRAGAESSPASLAQRIVVAYIRQDCGEAHLDQMVPDLAWFLGIGVACGCSTLSLAST